MEMYNDEEIHNKIYQDSLERTGNCKDCQKVTGLFAHKMCSEHVKMTDEEIAKAFRTAERNRIAITLTYLKSSLKNPLERRGVAKAIQRIKQEGR